MKLNKISNFVGFKISKIEDYIRSVDTDLRNLFLFTQSRVRFGSRDDNTFGENVAGEFQTFTTPTATNVEFSVTHSLGAVPTGGYLVVTQANKGSLYTATGSNTATTAYFRSDATSTSFTVFLLK